jgi:hypothetical protein
MGNVCHVQDVGAGVNPDSTLARNDLSSLLAWIRYRPETINGGIGFCKSSTNIDMCR